jgi:hypothetical protein
MQAYAIEYQIRGKEKALPYHVHVDAKSLISAKKKIGRKHGYKDGRMIKVESVYICGYL